MAPCEIVVRSNYSVTQMQKISVIWRGSGNNSHAWQLSLWETERTDV